MHFFPKSSSAFASACCATATLALAAAAAASLPPAATAKAAVIQSARVVRLIDGKEVFINGRTAKVNDTARSGQQLRTGRSRAELLFDGRTVGFIGRSSVLNVGSQCLRLDRGSVLMSGPQRTCLGTKVLGVMGTTTIVSRNLDSYDVITLEGVAHVGEPGGFEEQRQSQPAPETGSGSAPNAPLPKRSVEITDGDPSGRTTYICGCEVAQFSTDGEFQRQAVMSRTQLLAALNRFTDEKLQLPEGVAERIQESIASCE
ncbi:MAG: hypothetical protein WBN89_00155 [Prochlorococcaceae cyanobacterium]